MSPNFNDAGAPPHMQIRVMGLLLGNLPDFVGEGKRRSKVFVGECAFQTRMIMGLLPATP
jgi:hypothetical protein